MSKELLETLTFKKADNFGHLQSEARYLKRLLNKLDTSGEDKDNCYFVRFRQGSEYFESGDEVSIGKGLTKEIIKIRQAVEALFFVAKKLPKEGGVKKNKKLFFQGQFKNLCSGGDDIIYDLAYYLRAFYSGYRSKQITDVSKDISDLAHSTVKRMEKLDDLLLNCCEE